MRYFLIVIAYLCICLPGCTKDDEKTVESSSPLNVAPGNGLNNEAAIFSLNAEKAEAYSVDKASSVFITLAPKGVYHINQEYPTSVTVSAPPGLAVTKSKFAKADAARFDEKLAKFDLPFSSNKSGTYQVDVKASFAMCTAETCIPFDKTLAVTLSVK
jgi:hypothetical protein